ncbi:heparan sulfate 2-O-sulfotransferase pipe isoform X4 [Musca domestica]|uniref:Heparan sulfate 2-O-sulfotransferase pipe isoform X4 n=1 Tax=Musca domestica TaxID=7370 RepID=A0ABM3VHL2_MUSDO|nr:heparan sulfate 2-O-sulfotransferase pipe isoform X4 [Musca domestica]
MSLMSDKSFKMKMRDVETAFKYRRFPYPKRSVELIALLAISCTFFLFMHTNKLNSRLKEMEMKLQPSEFSALGLTGSNHLDGPKPEDINTLHGTYQYLKSTGQLERLHPKLLNNTPFSQFDFLFFNRVPKVGSEQLIELIRQLGQVNDFSVSRAPFSAPVRYHLNEVAQAELVDELYEMGPSHAHSMHVNFINFRRYDTSQPIYINLVRDPVERVISWFYYRRTPWSAVQNYRVTKKFFDDKFYKKDYHDCVLNADPECVYEQGASFTQTQAQHIRQTLFFCGHDPVCEPFNSYGALQKAKEIVEHDFAVVGSWEDVNVTLRVLENYIPKYFRGATKLYYDDLAKVKRNSNNWKPKIREDVKALVRKNFTREYEFYHFCKQRLYRQYFALDNV